MSKERKTLYSKIIDDIKRQIEENKLMPGEQLPTEMELAKKYNVSRITSQRALVELEREGLIYRRQGKGSFVLPFRSNTTKDVTHKVISIILPSDGPTGRRIDYIDGANDYLNQKGYLLTIHTTNDNLEQERNFLIDLPNQGISGIIYYPTARKNFDILYGMHLKNYPIVIIDKYFQSLPLCYVVSDNFTGGYEATTYLIESGHTRIAYLSNLNIEDISTVRERFFGYCNALKDNNISLDYDIVHFNLTYEGDEFAFSTVELLRSIIEGGVTAIFAEHDYLAISIARVLENMEINVPGDVAIVGFDNIELLEHLNIPIISVDQNFYEIGRAAASMVVEIIEQGSCEVERRIIPVKLIPNQSDNLTIDNVK